MDFHSKLNTMRYLNFSTDSEITLIAKSEHVIDATPAKAIEEAIKFVKEHKLKSVDLYYDGFTMHIDSDVNIRELVSELYNWRSTKTAP